VAPKFLAPKFRSLAANSPRFHDLSQAVGRKDNKELAYRKIFISLADPKQSPPPEFEDRGLARLSELQEAVEKRGD
jgi:hypothetical protein